MYLFLVREKRQRKDTGNRQSSSSSSRVSLLPVTLSKEPLVEILSLTEEPSEEQDGNQLSAIFISNMFIPSQLY